MIPVLFGELNYYKQHSDVQHIACTGFPSINQIKRTGDEFTTPMAIITTRKLGEFYPKSS